MQNKEPTHLLDLRKCVFFFLRFLKQLQESNPSPTTNNVLFRVFNFPSPTCKPIRIAYNPKTLLAVSSSRAYVCKLHGNPYLFRLHPPIKATKSTSPYSDRCTSAGLDASISKEQLMQHKLNHFHSLIASKTFTQSRSAMRWICYDTTPSY